MLTLLLGTDWTANRDAVLKMISGDVAAQKTGVVLMVPELISHDTERRLCAAAGDTASRFAEVLTFTRLAKRVSDAAGYGALECLDNGGRLVAMGDAEVSCIDIRGTNYHIIATRYIYETEETVKLYLFFSDLNKRFWLTKEEAEEALSGIQNDE